LGGEQGDFEDRKKTNFSKARGGGRHLRGGKREKTRPVAKKKSACSLRQKGGGGEKENRPPKGTKGVRAPQYDIYWRGREGRNVCAKVFILEREKGKIF